MMASQDSGLHNLLNFPNINEQDQKLDYGMSYADAVVKGGNKGAPKVGSKSPGKGAKAVMGAEGKLVDPKTGETLSPERIA